MSCTASTFVSPDNNYEDVVCVANASDEIRATGHVKDWGYISYDGPAGGCFHWAKQHNISVQIRTIIYDWKTNSLVGSE